MQVSIKELNIPLKVGNTGTEFQVKSTQGEHRGRFIVNKTGVIWCKGKTSNENGKCMSWDDLIDCLMAEGE
jgi:hypothetical protein